MSRTTAARAAIALLGLAAAVAQGAGEMRPEHRAFVEQMTAAHGFDAAWVAGLLANAEPQPSIIDAISRPAEKAKPWHEYRRIFVNEKRIEAGIRFWDEHGDRLEAIASQYGVPPHIVVGILGVETYYGRITGRYRVLDSLTTLAFDYPPRSRFFRSELEQFLLLTREEAFDPLAAMGSYAGAMGVPQFISSSYRAYSVDSNGDGRRDLWSDWDDVVGSVANYFRAHGWRAGEPVVVPARATQTAVSAFADESLELKRTVAELRAGGVELPAALPGAEKAMLVALEGEHGPEYWVGLTNFYVITRYNRSTMYALAVHQLGSEIASRRSHAPG